jgi:hypothetical protein
MSTAPVTNEHLSDEEFQAVWARRCEMLNWAGITYRYHRKRQRFFDVMDKLTQAAAVGGGVAVAGRTLPDNLPLVGGLIAFTGLLALVYGYGDKRQCHKELAEQAIQLAADVQSLPVRQVTEVQLGVWERVRASIDLREPPNLKTLVSKCEWEQALAEGHKDHVARPKWWHEAHMHFF